MGSCIHSKFEEKKKKVEYKDEKGNVWMIGCESDGYRHFCDKNPEGYEKWHEEHKYDTYDTYKNFPMDCYEGTELSKNLEGVINMSNDILSSIKK